MLRFLGRLSLHMYATQPLTHLSPRLALAPNARRTVMVHSQATQMRSTEPGRHRLSVAVVGGGAAGLAAARELLRAGHAVTVLERGGNVGGVWDYSEQTEDHPLGLGRRHVHGSMYANLRTNLPREVMGFSDFPFDGAFPGSVDKRQFCSHEEVQRYLEAFAAEFGLLKHVRLGTEVQRLAPVPPSAASVGSSSSSSSSSPAMQAGNGSSSGGPSRSHWLRWEVTTRPASLGDPSSTGLTSSNSTGSGTSTSSSSSQLYDAVVVCNGHYSRPRLPQLPGQDVFPGLQMHSHNYRRPEMFRGQTVVLLGASSSGVDIAEEVANAGAKQVYLCARVWENPLTGDLLPAPGSSINTSNGAAAASSSVPADASRPAPAGATATLHPAVVKAANLAELHADGSVTLVDGTRIPSVDCVMYCTGYIYDFPFLAGSGDLVSVEDNRVGPLYQHIFPPAAAPTLSFVGLPWKVVPFPQFELQSRWIARVLSGAAHLSSREEMEAHTAEFYASLAAAGVPQRYTHRMSGGVQWEYNRWLAQQCGEECTSLGTSAWREAMYAACGNSRKLHAERYRDAPLPGAQAVEQAAREEAARMRQQRAALRQQPQHDPLD